LLPVTAELVGNAVVALMELSGTSVGRPVVVSEAVLFVHAPTAVEAPIVLLFQPVVAPAVVFAVTPTTASTKLVVVEVDTLAFVVDTNVDDAPNEVAVND